MEVMKFLYFSSRKSKRALIFGFHGCKNICSSSFALIARNFPSRSSSFSLKTQAFLLSGNNSCHSKAGFRCFHCSSRLLWDEYESKKFYDAGEDPYRRAWEALTFDFKRTKRRYEEAKYDAYRRKGIYSYTKHEVLRYELLPYDVDFLIIGGGIIGSSVAWWLKQRMRDEDLKCVVVECDDTFTKSSTVLSTGGIRQQFANPENIEMSLFGAEFLRHAGEHLRILDSEPPDIDFVPMGYLFLSRTQEEAKEMEENWKLQTHLGAKVGLLNKDELSQRFPFINFDDVVLGSLGLEGEGVVDSWQFLGALREKNVTLGVQYIKAKVERMLFRENDSYSTVGVHPDEAMWSNRMLIGCYIRPQKTDAAPRPVRAMCVVNAAGAWSGEVAELAQIGKGKGLLAVPVPVVPRKRYVFVVHCPDGPGLNMPYLIDPSGVWCRREDYGHLYLCGKTPTEVHRMSHEDVTVLITGLRFNAQKPTEASFLPLEEDAQIDHSNLDVDYNYFYDKIWPTLARRIPAFEKLKIKSAWAGYYDYNKFDQNPIIGGNLLFTNFFQVCGFSGHGIQHAIAAGRGFMEFWHDGAYKAINLKRLSMSRILRKKPMKAECAV